MKSLTVEIAETAKAFSSGFFALSFKLLRLIFLDGLFG
jgi:hypothetical protein